MRHPRIVLDPGHGGHAPGCSYGGLVEKIINIEIVDIALSMLQDIPIELSSTRDGDVFMTQSQRGSFSGENLAELVVSVHVNASDSGELQGADIFHWDGNGQGELVARAIAEAMPTTLRTDRIWAASTDDEDSWLERPSRILAAHRATTVLVECGYATADVDRDFLRDPWGQTQVAAALASGIARYCELMSPAPAAGGRGDGGDALCQNVSRETPDAVRHDGGLWTIRSSS